MTETAPWAGTNFVVLDVEGNGQRPPDLVELGVVPIQAGTVGQPVSWLVRPQSKITWQARRVHGLSDKDVVDQPAFEDVADHVREVFADAIPIGHNVKVDLGVMARKLPEWQPAEAVDTLRMARAAWPSLPSHKLGALVEHHGLDKDLPDGLRPHRVDWDVLVTARLFTRLIKALDITTLAELREVGGIELTQPRAHEREPELRLFD